MRSAGDSCDHGLDHSYGHVDEYHSHHTQCHVHLPDGAACARAANERAHQAATGQFLENDSSFLGKCQKSIVNVSFCQVC